MQKAAATIKQMTSKTYRLTAPYRIEEAMLERAMGQGEVAVKPLMGSICHADLRYYTGNRRPESLAEKLPMALIHEGIGEVVDSGDSRFQPGQLVVIVPNIPGDQRRRAGEADSAAAWADNYSAGGRFLGSGTDGIAQSCLVLPGECVVPIPEEVPLEIAVLSELSTVSHQALGPVSSLLGTAAVAVFGDGPVGFITAALLHHLYGLDANRLRVFGVVPEKLAQFDFASCSNVLDYNFAASPQVDIAIECTGGKFSSAAINQAISALKPGGQLILLGVTEELVPINTRDILEKGITVRGSSRSSFHDYPPVIAAMRKSSYQQTLRRLLPDQLTTVRSADDFARAMQEVSERPHWKKTVLAFQW